MTISIASELHAILSGLLGGARYGFKIRVPHALVMTVLFRRDLSSKAKLRTVFKLALEHASNLAKFAGMYKSILAALKWASRKLHQSSRVEQEGMLRKFGRIFLSMIVDGPYYSGQRLVSRPPGHPERSFHALVAGAVGGYFVWGRYSSVNYQIVLYLASRVLVAVMKRVQKHHNLPHFENSYPAFAAAVWGIVMMLFEESPDVLHPSLKKSMDEIYRYNISKDSTAAQELPCSNVGHQSQTAGSPVDAAHSIRTL